MQPVSLLIIGAGGRGAGYASFAAQFPDKAQVVGVAEPRQFYREDLAKRHAIPVENIFTDWRAAAAKARFADVAIIATQDKMHTEPLVALASKGYHLLLEKPMAPTPEECRRITEAVLKAKVIFAVCHVLRYTRYTRALKNILDSGRIGEIVSIQHVEPVGYWHQAHSFVRGNWRNEKESSCMLLAKCCHDLDLIRHLVNNPCEAVSSFGNLKHFNRKNWPTGAADRCLDCPVESNCPYSALKIYLGRVKEGKTGWPVNVLTPDVSAAAITTALREGPYGRCVYACDNDVVDHQVVNLVFRNGATAAMTMTAFGGGGRKTRIFGTRGEISGNSEQITVTDFLTDKSETIEVNKEDNTILGGHGGGDFGLMNSFIEAVAKNDRRLILSGVEETLESHMIVFAAEQARLTGQVVNVPKFIAQYRK